MALVALLVVDVALVMRAFDHVDASPPPTTPRPAAQSAPTPSATATRTRPVPDAPSAASQDRAAGRTLLALAADGTVVQSTSGSCAESASPGLELRGAGEQVRDLDLPDGLTEVLAVDASTSDLTLVGADRECSPAAWTREIDDGGWTSAPPDESWFLTSDDTPEVHSPGGRIDVPCLPAGLSTLNAVRLICETGTILGTSDGGGSWVPLGSVDAVAAAYDGPSRGVALAARASCSVAVLATDNGGASWDRTACIEGAEGRAVTLRGDLVAAVVDDVLWRSEDAGSTWERLG